MSGGKQRSFEEILLAAHQANSGGQQSARARVHGFLHSLFEILFPQLSEISFKTQADVAKAMQYLRGSLEEAIAYYGSADSKVPAASVDLFIRDLPVLRGLMLADAEAICAGDPAATGLDEVIAAYPGFYAIATQRVAHFFFKSGVPIMPRLMTEYAHQLTGIDIHPGASLGKSFAIDHGTGVVIGETTVIRDRVKIYQGVTLGGLSVRKSLAGTKRHPTIESDVVIYANATILGGDTVVGSGSVIGGNVFLTESVPPNSIVQMAGEVTVKVSEKKVET